MLPAAELRAVGGTLLGAKVASIKPAAARAPEARTRAWRVTTAAGEHALLKVATDAEIATSRVLGELAPGCVPSWIGADIERGLLAIEWIPGRTLDDTLQKLGPSGVPAGRLTDAYAEIEAAFVTARARLADWTHLVTGTGALSSLAEQAEAGLGWLAGRLDRPLSKDWRRAFAGQVDALTGATPTFGSLDVNAHNVLVGARGFYFIDFGAIGWDWPARRLVHYGSALGALGRTPGRFCSVFERDVETPSAPADELDMHDLLFWGTAALRLAAAVKAPTSKPGAAVLASWGRPKPRLAQLIPLLARSLSDATKDLRAPFAGCDTL